MHAHRFSNISNILFLIFIIFISADPLGRRHVRESSGSLYLSLYTCTHVPLYPCTLVPLYLVLLYPYAFGCTGLLAPQAYWIHWPFSFCPWTPGQKPQATGHYATSHMLKLLEAAGAREPVQEDACRVLSTDQSRQISGPGNFAPLTWDSNISGAKLLETWATGH